MSKPVRFSVCIDALFNGRDFTGWKLHVDEEGVDVSDVWSVKDGVVNCKGVPDGYMRTEGKYRNYVLHLEWRWVGRRWNWNARIGCKRLGGSSAGTGCLWSREWAPICRTQRRCSFGHGCLRPTITAGGSA